MPDWVRISAWQAPDAPQAEVIRATGYVVILASAAAGLLPAGNFEQGPQIVGALMIAVGLLETIANFLRATGRCAAMAAGCISVAAGILIFTRPVTSFVTTVYLVIGWLLVRGLLLLLSAVEAAKPTKRATLVVAAMDLILAVIVWTGLTASALVIALFGPTAPIIADFAWIVAISFVSAGLLLMKIANDQSAAKEKLMP